MNTTMGDLRWAVGGAATLTFLLPLTSWAQAAKPVQFAIQGFEILGENPLSSGETTRVLAPYLRADASIDTLQFATASLEAALRDKGFGLYRVNLPPQEVGTTVKLNIVKFTVGRVSVQNAGAYSQSNIRGSVPELQEGTSPNFKTLATQTAIANENPAKQITVSMKESDQADRVDAVIEVKPSKPWSMVLSVNNTGSEATGKDRVTVSGSHANLFDKDHQFTGAYTTSLAKSSDVKQLGLSYRLPFYAASGVLNLSHTRSDVLGSFGSFTSTGAGHTFGANYALHLAPQGSYRSFVHLSLDDKLYKGTQLNGTPISLDTRSRTVSLGYTGKAESENQTGLYSVDGVTNIKGGRGNDLYAYTNAGTNIDIQDHHWQALRLSAQFSRLTATKWVWSVRGNAQLTSKALISGEQFGLGGASSVRGTAERAMTGDKGYFVSAELTTPAWWPGLRFVGFVDAGWVRNNLPNGTTKPTKDGLSSAGLGLRHDHSAGTSLSLDYARIVKGSVVPLAVNSNAPQSGDNKLHLSAAWRF